MIDELGVVGLGMMGSGIVETVASHGIPVVAVRATGGDVSAARSRLVASLDRRVQRGTLDAAERDTILSRVRFSTSLSDLGSCDLVIESGLEEQRAKCDLLAHIEEHLTHGAVLASNTSSLPLDVLADSLKRPEQFLALHFFNPVRAMKLVEVGVTDRTAPGVHHTAQAFVKAIDKTPVEVSATPGYVVNRLLVPFLLHAIETLESNVGSAPAIDEAMKLGCGHPMGPLALADLIGLDVVLAMARTLQVELRDSRYRAPSLLRRLVLAGHLGRKSGKGIYDYAANEPAVNPAIHFDRPIQLAVGDAE